MSPDDETAFTAWAAARQRRLLRSAYLLTLDHARAEALVREALVTVARRWRRFRHESPDACARAILVHDNVAWRRWHRAEQPPERAGTEDGEPSLLLHHVLARLTPRQRAVLVLRYHEDLSDAQAAAALGVGTGTVKSQGLAALQRLRSDAPRLAGLIGEPAFTRLLNELPGDPPALDLASGAWAAAQRQRRRQAVLSVVAAAVVVVAVALGASALADGSGSGPDATADSRPGTPVASPPASSGNADPASANVTFRTPSGNITCSVSGTSVQCAVARKSWHVTQAQLASCGHAALEGASLQAGEAPRYLCATDVPAPGRNRTLGYGQSVTLDPFTCTSSPAGVTCRDRATGHAFTVSREGYSFS